MKKPWHVILMVVLLISLVTSVMYPVKAYSITDPYLPLAQAGLRSVFDGVGNPIIKQHLWNKEHIRIGQKDVYLYEFDTNVKIGYDSHFEALKELLRENKDQRFIAYINDYYKDTPPIHPNKQGIEAYSAVGTVINLNVGIAIVVENGKTQVMGWIPIKDVVLFPLKDLFITKDMWKQDILQDFKLWLTRQDNR